MKQPMLEELKVAINRTLKGGADPLELVNRFIITPSDSNPPMMDDYWIHRFCAFAELLVTAANEKVAKKRKKKHEVVR